jgi:hypothetical protein
MLYAMWRRGWIDEDDFRLMRYRTHDMLRRTFIPLDEDHGGWAAAYDSHEGKPIKYLSYWEHRHSHEYFAPDEPLEMWGLVTRDAFYDHSTHYWSAKEQLVDELLRAETVEMREAGQVVRCHDDGLAAGVPGPRAMLVAKGAGAKSVTIRADDLKTTWRITETRSVKIGSQDFWLLAVEKA